MHFTVWGTGAMGGIAGAYMARAGHRVTFVDRVREHVDAMKSRGLEVRGFDGTFKIPVSALHPEEVTGPLDVVLLAVKAQDTEDAVRAIMPSMGPATAIVSLQNGLCERMIADLAGVERTVGAFVNYGGDYVEPGVLSFAGPGAFFVGELDGRSTPRVAAIVEHLRAWGDVRATDNIWGYLWTKVAFINMLYATAITGETVADVFERKRALLVELACEVIDVARCEGARHLEAFDSIEPSLFHPRESQDWGAIDRSLDSYVARMRKRPRQRTGFWRDLAVRKRKTEVDFHSGLVVRIGATHGLALPLTRGMVDIVHAIERGECAMGWSTLEPLERLMAHGGR